MSSTKQIVNTLARIKHGALETMPDTDRYKCRFTIKSETSDSIYMVSFDVAGPYWTCSCLGNIRFGSCKHLESMGLKGRKFGKTLSENLKYLSEFNAK